ncbi:hypothetical protein AB0I72_24395 [Nocardiopsis sp. NPDC049922]|uniref:hypothetical protein n=1 Tax=Nocardiopsis sp. NPDC049922 TaxID=3155157 RepID=UPI0033F0313D
MRHCAVPTEAKDYLFLLGREVVAENDVLSVSDPALRVLPVGYLPIGVELGVVFAHVEPTSQGTSGSQLQLEVIRPSGTAALTMSGIIGVGPSAQAPIWAHTLRVVIDETGAWTIAVESRGKHAIRVLDIVLEAET